jgi:hypothetical protein
MGNCVVNQCPAKAGQGSTLTWVTSGQVTVTGFEMDVPLNFRLNRYTSADFTQPLWTDSRPLNAQVAASDQVPGFTMDVVAPHPIVLTSPSVKLGTALKISKSANLVTTWTGGVDGTLMVIIMNNNGLWQDVIISCSAPAAAGSTTVPAALLSMLGTMGTFQTTLQAATTRKVDDWTMEFAATIDSARVDATFMK